MISDFADENRFEETHYKRRYLPTTGESSQLSTPLTAKTQRHKPTNSTTQSATSSIMDHDNPFQARRTD
jgi:hypothetical protein